eukprot:scaffold179524_cov18-Tisochrysis_lutea.AAC.1
MGRCWPMARRPAGRPIPCLGPPQSSPRTSVLISVCYSLLPQELHTTLWPQAGIIPRALKNLFERLPPKYARVMATSPRAHATVAATPVGAARPEAQPPCTPIAPTPHRHGRSLEPSWLVKLSVSVQRGIGEGLAASNACALIGFSTRWWQRVGCITRTGVLVGGIVWRFIGCLWRTGCLRKLAGEAV